MNKVFCGVNFVLFKRISRSKNQIKNHIYDLLNQFYVHTYTISANWYPNVFETTFSKQVRTTTKNLNLNWSGRLVW